MSDELQVPLISAQIFGRWSPMVTMTSNPGINQFYPVRGTEFEAKVLRRIGDEPNSWVVTSEETFGVRTWFEASWDDEAREWFDPRKAGEARP